MTSYLYFNISAKTEFLQHVILVGNIPQMGNWNPSKGLLLSTTPDKYPQWFNQEIIDVPKGTKLQFKCVIMFGDKVIQWEQLKGQQNREYKVEHFKSVIYLKFNYPQITEKPMYKALSGQDSEDMDLTGLKKINKPAHSNFWSDSMLSSSSTESKHSFKGSKINQEDLGIHRKEWEKQIHSKKHKFQAFQNIQNKSLSITKDPFTNFMNELNQAQQESLKNKEKFPPYKSYKNYLEIESALYQQQKKINQQQEKNDNLENIEITEDKQQEQNFNKPRRQSFDTQLDQHTIIFCSWCAPLQFIHSNQQKGTKINNNNKDQKKNFSQNNSTKFSQQNSVIVEEEINLLFQNLNQNKSQTYNQFTMDSPNTPSNTRIKAESIKLNGNGNGSSNFNGDFSQQLNNIQQINEIPSTKTISNDSSILQISKQNSSNFQQQQQNQQQEPKKTMKRMTKNQSISSNLNLIPFPGVNQTSIQDNDEHLNKSSSCYPYSGQYKNNSQYSCELQNEINKKDLSQSQQILSNSNNSIDLNDFSNQESLNNSVKINENNSAGKKKNSKQLPQKEKKKQRKIPGFNFNFDDEIIFKNKIKVQLNHNLLISSLYQTFLAKGIKFVWIAHCDFQFTIEAEQKEFQTFVLENYNIYLLFYKKDEVNTFQRTYLNKFRFKTRNITLLEDDQSWLTYKKINQDFTDAAYYFCEKKSPIFSVITCDFHLFLLPSYLRVKIQEKNIFDLRKLQIVYIMNRSFPQYELLAQLSENAILLHSILFSDIIIFSSHEYAEYFFHTLERYHMYHKHTKTGQIVLLYNGREVQIILQHPGINFEMVNSIRLELKNQKQQILQRNKKENRITFLSVSYLSKSTGFEFTFQAFYNFCKKQRKENVKYVYKMTQIIYTTYDGEFDTHIEEKQYYQKILKLKKKINTEFGENIIEILDGHKLEFYEIALKMMSSNFFIKGFLKLNAVTMHYLYYMALKQDYLLITNHMLNYLTELSNTYMINLFDIDGMVKTMEKAILRLENDTELELKVKYDQEKLEEYCSMTKWMNKVFQQIHKRIRQQNHDSKYIITSDEAFCGDTILRLHESQGDLSDLSYETVKYSYNNSKNSLFIFGFTGVFFDKGEKNFDEPNKQMIKRIEELAKNPNNTIFIITEFDSSIVDKYLGKIQNIILITNGGTKIKQNGKQDEFIVTVNDSYSKIIWKPAVQSHMMQFVNKTNGSYILDQENEISWNCENVTSEFAQTQKDELVNILLQNVEGMPGTEVYEGQTRVSVRPSYMGKGLIGELAIKATFQSKGKIDFLMCIGGRHKFEEGNQEMLSVISNFAFNKLNNFYFDKNAEKILAFLLASNQSSNMFTLQDISEVNECLKYILQKHVHINDDNVQILKSEEYSNSESENDYNMQIDDAHQYNINQKNKSDTKSFYTSSADFSQEEEVLIMPEHLHHRKKSSQHSEQTYTCTSNSEMTGEILNFG